MVTPLDLRSLDASRRPSHPDGRRALIEVGCATDRTSVSAAQDDFLPAELKIVSPELVLVDPRLSIRARKLLADPGETLARMGRRRTPSHARELDAGTSADPASANEEEVAGALRRITELSEVVPPKPRRRRLLTLVTGVGAASAVGLLVLDLQLGLHQWPF